MKRSLILSLSAPLVLMLAACAPEHASVSPIKTQAAAASVNTRLSQTSWPKNEWWKDYNDIKHKRTSFGESGGANYTKANLKNMILCYAALFILESTFSEHLVQQEQNDYCMFESKLFGYSLTKKCTVILP